MDDEVMRDSSRHESWVVSMSESEAVVAAAAAAARSEERDDQVNRRRADQAVAGSHSKDRVTC